MTGAAEAVLLADDRASSFTRYAARNRADGLVLLRFEEARADMSAQYLDETAHLPDFWIRRGAPLRAEARRYLDWIRRPASATRPSPGRTSRSASRGSWACRTSRPGRCGGCATRRT